MKVSATTKMQAAAEGKGAILIGYICGSKEVGNRTIKGDVAIGRLCNSKEGD